MNTSKKPACPYAAAAALDALNAIAAERAAFIAVAPRHAAYRVRPLDCHGDALDCYESATIGAARDDAFLALMHHENAVAVAIEIGDAHACAYGDWESIAAFAAWYGVNAPADQRSPLAVADTAHEHRETLFALAAAVAEHAARTA